MKDDDKNYPLPVILDGKVDEDVLLQIGKDKDWLSEALREENLKQEEVFYGFYRDGEMFLIKNDIK